MNNATDPFVEAEHQALVRRITEAHEKASKNIAVTLLLMLFFWPAGYVYSFGWIKGLGWTILALLPIPIFGVYGTFVTYAILFIAGWLAISSIHSARKFLANHQ
jgi:hypothetical protein